MGGEGKGEGKRKKEGEERRRGGRKGRGGRRYTSHKQLCFIRNVLHHVSTAVEELGISLCTHRNGPLQNKCTGILC